MNMNVKAKWKHAPDSDGNKLTSFADNTSSRSMLTPKTVLGHNLSINAMATSGATPGPAFYGVKGGRHSGSKSKKHKRTASLTDLRPEDKKKVANLIQELANLGSEKEAIEKRLRKERVDFEVAIKDLINDQKALLTERKAVQSELNSCQQMLSQLQEAVLHRPTASSLSSQCVNENNGSVVSNNEGKENHHRGSALDNYISKYNSTYDTYTIDALSDIESVTSEAAQCPRTSSTMIGKTHTVEESNTSAYSVDYPNKDQLFQERAKLIQEQKLLRQKLIEQEECLRQTQRRLHVREQEAHRAALSNQHSKQRDWRGIQKDTTFTKEVYSHVTAPGTPAPPRTPALTTSFAQPPAVVDISSNTLDQGSYRPKSKTGYNVGVQVGLQDHGLVNSFRQTQDHGAQTELPMQLSQSHGSTQANLFQQEATTPNKLYVGNRLVPSPSNCLSRSNSSMEETIQKTNKLLQSARKIIDEAKAAPTSSNTSSSTTSASKAKTCKHSYYERYGTPPPPPATNCISDSSLATDINSDSFMMNSRGKEKKDEEDVADRTELDLLEEVFYVK